MMTLASQESTLRARVQTQPNDHAAWHELGLLYFNAGNLPLAMQCIEAAIAVNGKVALYHRNIGEMYRRAGQLEKSALAGRRAVKLAPADLDAHYNLGLAYTDAKDYKKAIECYKKALKLDPRHNLSWNNLGSALEQLGDKTEALKAYEKARSIDPRHAEAQNNAGAIYAEQGRLDEARACFQAAIAAKPDFVEAHYNLCSLKTYTRDDPHLAMLEALYARRDQLPDPARIRYCFALGKALDDTGDYDRAFAAYEEGNRLQHALLPMDEARADALLEDILRLFDRDFFAARRHWRISADPARTPIFIVGMPRSGTTLLEQILCSHAEVHGAGELTDLHEVVSEATSAGSGAFFTAKVAALTEADLERIGKAYLERVWKLSPQSRFITDKMPANFFYLGLIHLALPHAKIIHAMRDPMDSCFSCFTRLFNDSMEFAYDQGTLGRYYRRYMTLMRHWRAVLPPGTILDLPYEDMVADTETQARRVLEFVGLPWDPNCLQFHKNDRLVKTASVAQVRKPIYKSSVGRWKHFARHLRPLYELVREFRPDDGADALFADAPPTPLESATAPLQAAHRLHAEGIALYQQNRFEDAIDKYDAALALAPDDAACWNSKGFALQDMDRMTDALACFERAVSLDPALAMARLNLGLAQLKLGDFANGWQNYEARWSGSAEAAAGKLDRPQIPLPQWRGEPDTRNQAILVVAEQGFGDTFQFARYLPLLAQRFAKVGFLCSPPTLRLLEWSFGDRIVLMSTMPADTATWHWQCALMSLPLAFGTRLETIPAEVPYLAVPEPARRHWAERLEAAAPGRLRIGIAWAGRKGHQYDARRSLAFERLLPLMQDPRVCWVNLQKWAPEDSRPDIPASLDWLDWTDELADFADTAALVANLDLVISIDSAMVHLAGGLDVPVWMLDRFDNEWRWLHHREDSPWYPSLRIFRQRAFGAWEEVIDRVRAALADLPAPRAILPPTPRPARLAPKVGAGATALPRESLPQNSLSPLPEANLLHQQGIAAWQAGRKEHALRLIEQAIARDGRVALFHSNLAEMNRQLGRLDAAIRHGQEAVALDPTLASAHSNLGIALYDAKRYDEAEACHRQALALDPDLLQSLNNLGSIARARKDRKTAAEWYRKALARDPDYLEALSNLGAVLVEDDEADAAAPSLERALQLQPAYPEALCNLGLVRIKQERMEEAAGLLQHSLQLRPGYPEALVGLARVMQEKDDLAQAERLLRQAVAVAPDKVDAWCQLGSVCMEQGEAEAAEAAYMKALEIDPEMSDALAGLGNLRLEQGKIDEAEAILKQAIALKPDNLGARFHLTQVKKVKPGDENLAALEARLPEIDRLSRDKRISLHYALGKAYDDLAEYDKAFPHFLEGARLKRSTIAYDPEAEAERIRRLMAICDRRYFEARRGAGDPSDVPVFVLGMPRSGTTLTEQIIASHPQVFGAGELSDLLTLIQQPIGGQPFPENLAALTLETLTQWGQEYVARLRRRAPQALRITDKMPANYLALGLIPLMLPNARIIHVRRNPVDTCLSCFTRLFNRGQEATYDLYELGRHYANYARLMNHWRTVLPPESFLEVAYEDIVADLEGQARRLIDWVGLEWDPACLAFHENRRSIRTASVTQVRQPIYTSSVERWRHYEKYLGPLMAGLGEFAPGKGSPTENSER